MVIIYGDFNCPYSYLASQRADLLIGAGVAVDWRAVEHAPRLNAGGGRPSDKDAWDRELTEVASLAQPDEHVPGLPGTISNTGAAVAAYAEAVTDNLADQLRGSLFSAMWRRGRNLSSPQEVRRVVTDLMWPQQEVADRLNNPDFPSRLLRNADMDQLVRRTGGTVTLVGEPLTTTGWQRIRQWRQEWLASPSQVVPTVIGSDQVVRPGVEGLRYLAELIGNLDLPSRLPTEAEASNQDSEHAPAAKAALPAPADGTGCSGAFVSLLPPPCLPRPCRAT